jgi:hypothetical protein
VNVIPAPYSTLTSPDCSALNTEYIPSDSRKVRTKNMAIDQVRDAMVGAIQQVRSAPQLYEHFVSQNASSVSQIESALRSLTYIIPGRFRESEIASESRMFCEILLSAWLTIIKFTPVFNYCHCIMTLYWLELLRGSPTLFCALSLHFTTNTRDFGQLSHPYIDGSL